MNEEERRQAEEEMEREQRSKLIPILLVMFGAIAAMLAMLIFAIVQGCAHGKAVADSAVKAHAIVASPTSTQTGAANLVVSEDAATDTIKYVVIGIIGIGVLWFGRHASFLFRGELGKERGVDGNDGHADGMFRHKPRRNHRESAGKAGTVDKPEAD